MLFLMTTFLMIRLQSFQELFLAALYVPWYRIKEPVKHRGLPSCHPSLRSGWERGGLSSIFSRGSKNFRAAAEKLDFAELFPSALRDDAPAFSRPGARAGL
jgi:hypothetical protein